jgi:hypothetical protein
MEDMQKEIIFLLKEQNEILNKIIEIFLYLKKN